MSAPAIAEPPADTPPTPPDIQPCADEGLQRTITGIVTDRPPGGRAVVGGGLGAGGAALADEQGLDLERSFATAMATRTCRSSRRSATRWRSRRSVDCARGRSAAVGRCFGAGMPGEPGAARARAHGGVLRRGRGHVSRAGCGPPASLATGAGRRRRRGRRGSRARAGRHRRGESCWARSTWSVRRCVLVFNHQCKLDPILIMKLLRAGSRAWRRRRLRTVGAGNSVRP